MAGRRAVLALAAAIVVAIVGAIGWDFLQLSRQVPSPAPPAEQADLIRVNKAARTLTLYRGATALKTYPVSLGSAPIGHKQQEGDGRTPEGRYAIDSRNSRSRFHLALHISYPDAKDRASAQRRAVPPGGDIMIHGLPNGLSWLGWFFLHRDWTDGCIAVTNSEMDEVWSRVAPNTAIEIVP